MLIQRLLITAQPTSVLSHPPHSVGFVWRVHLDTFLVKLGVQWIAVIHAVADQILRLRVNRVEAEGQLHERDFMMVGTCFVTASGSPWRSTIPGLAAPCATLCNDCLPAIGPSRNHPNVFYAFGHGQPRTHSSRHDQQPGLPPLLGGLLPAIDLTP